MSDLVLLDTVYSPLCAAWNLSIGNYRFIEDWRIGFVLMQIEALFVSQSGKESSAEIFLIFCSCFTFSTLIAKALFFWNFDRNHEHLTSIVLCVSLDNQL